MGRDVEFQAGANVAVSSASVSSAYFSGLRDAEFLRRSCSHLPSMVFYAHSARLDARLRISADTTIFWNSSMMNREARSALAKTEQQSLAEKNLFQYLPWAGHSTLPMGFVLIFYDILLQVIIEEGSLNNNEMMSSNIEHRPPSHELPE